MYVNGYMASFSTSREKHRCIYRRARKDTNGTCEGKLGFKCDAESRPLDVDKQEDTVSLLSVEGDDADWCR